MNTRTPKKPDIDKAAQLFSEFLDTVAALRHPETGCPWDNEQTHQSLTKYMLEEAYEAAEVMEQEKLDCDDLAGELGDVLLQVVLNSQLGVDHGTFSIVDVISSINSKMRRRHPHVFGDGNSSRDKKDIKTNWAKIKEQEEIEKSGGTHVPKNKGIFESAKAHKVRPSTLQAHKIGEIARRIDFDWATPAEVLAQFNSEVDELNQEYNKSLAVTDHLLDEIGDVYFTLSQYCRKLGVNPEMASQRGNEKFLNRFKKLESIAQTKGIDPNSCGLEKLEKLWKEAKS